MVSLTIAALSFSESFLPKTFSKWMEMLHFCRIKQFKFLFLRLSIYLVNYQIAQFLTIIPTSLWNCLIIIIIIICLFRTRGTQYISKDAPGATK